MALSEDDQRCRLCIYHGNLRGYVSCHYLERTGKRRGCDPGLSCRRFEPLKRAASPILGYASNDVMYALDMEAWARLRALAPYSVIAMRLGVCSDTLRITARRGTISRRLSELIREAYHIDLVKTE